LFTSENEIDRGKREKMRRFEGLRERERGRDREREGRERK